MSLLCSFHVGLDRSGEGQRFLDSCHGLLAPPNCNSVECRAGAIRSAAMSTKSQGHLQQFCGGVMSRYTGHISNGPWDTRNSQVIEPPRCISRRNDQSCVNFATPITIALPLHCNLQNHGRVESLPGLALTSIYDFPNSLNSWVIKMPKHFKIYLRS